MNEEEAMLLRLHEAIGSICDLIPVFWRWGDGEGGWLLEQLRLSGGISERGEPPSTVRTKQKISRDLARRVMERDAYRCVTCGGYEFLTCDHIVPESMGGVTEIGNLQTMCRSCNSAKGARL